MAEANLEESDSFLQLAREIAYGHHEKWDGSGYPNGISGVAIPLAARMMAVADVYDALISRRVYKSAMPHEVAVGIIVDGRGSHFDPAIVDAFITVHPRFLEISDAHRDAESFE
jgi:putative two-component system response regulator